MRIELLSPEARRFQPIALAQARRVPVVAPLGRAPRVHIWSIGCQMNDVDRERLAEQLAETGCVPEVELDDADIAILVTCAVRQNAEQKVYGKFKELVPWKRARPGRAIALTGCMGVEHGTELLTRLPELDWVFDVREPDGFLDRLRATWASDIDGPMPIPASDRLSAHVPVIGGCDEMCTYCIVPFVRGREVSRPADDVVADVRRLVARGVREVTLLGQNVNSYRDPEGGGGLAELMASVDAVPGLLRQRFLTSHPRNASPALFSAMRDLPTACEQLHLPVQAGNDNLLRRMRRVYSVAEYEDILGLARSQVPGLTLSTDIIVGFCGETDAEFLDTENLLRRVHFDVVHLAAYTPRPGTAAMRRDDDVPLPEKKRRLNHLLALQREIATERNLALVGSPVEVLIEGLGADGRRHGRSRGGKVCWLPPGPGAAGTVVRGQVTGSSTWHLLVTPETAAA